MQQYIAPQILKVNGQPSPCECEEGIVCAYCVQANLILWERAERPEENAENRVLRAIKESGPRKVSRLTGIDHKTISYWIKRGKIPPRHFEKLRIGLGMAA